jgi:calcineurin-like phosphoesterase family protein
MSIFYVSDTHLDHPDILEWCSGTRPFDNIDEMNDWVVEVWNSIVGKKDEVRIIGDFAFKRHGRWANALNGKKFLIVGNHDGMNLDALAGLQDVEPSTIKAVQQFRRVMSLHETTHMGQKMAMSHYWLGTWDGSSKGAWNLHGHVHGRRRESLPDEVGHGGLWLDVGWDVHKRPLAFEEIDKMMGEKLLLMPKAFRDRAYEQMAKYRG